MGTFIAKNNLLIIMIISLLSFSTYAEEAAQGNPESSGAIQLTWVGCGITKKAFMNELAAAFSQESGIQINIQGGGATRGIRETAAGKVDMGGSCRYKMESSDLEKGAILKPVAWDALVVITHPDNKVNNITLDQLRGVLEGRITNWKQLGGSDSNIKLFAREGKMSGVGRTLRKLVFANYNKEFEASQFFKSSGPLEAAVEKDKDAIAITGISSARKLKAKILQLEGKTPDYQNIVNGSYILYRPLYLAVNAAGKNAKVVDSFYKFTHSPKGKNILRDNGAVPYLDALSLVMKQVEQDERAMGRGVYRN
ncbi:MAG: substrate-binding domain-containing protein [Gammaproteobacteria bacterium]|nr:substrate-binding domain-containing protein [Gammaproteobacteria bacterium]MDH5592871.1 substrate-binding domain-containing protein [Gammaproteobacteria bacterium]MDH5614726.1 substrate-binding domain-containing protein [Gammaproteobacteria bacterium]